MLTNTHHVLVDWSSTQPVILGHLQVSRGRDDMINGCEEKKTTLKIKIKVMTNSAFVLGDGFEHTELFLVV